MAERRMFAKTIIDSDAFLDMPLSTQALYFHLSMRADDDGFVNNPRKIQRMVGAADDDLKILISKRFVIPFESGVCVIKHWRIHNYIRNDRYTETVYKEEKSRLEIKENKSYTMANAVGIPDVCQEVDDRYPQVRLDEFSTGKGITPIVPLLGESNCTQGESLTVEMAGGMGNEKTEDHSTTLVEERFSKFWAAYPRKQGKGDAEKSWKKIKPTAEMFEKIMKAVDAHKTCEQWKKNHGQFIPYPATWLNRKQWNDDPSSTSRKNYHDEEAL